MSRITSYEQFNDILDRTGVLRFDAGTRHVISPVTLSPQPAAT